MYKHIICSLTFLLLVEQLIMGRDNTLQVNEKFFKWGYRVGVKSKGDKIGMDYTHGAVG